MSDAPPTPVIALSTRPSLIATALAAISALDVAWMAVGEWRACAAGYATVPSAVLESMFAIGVAVLGVGVMLGDRRAARWLFGACVALFIDRAMAIMVANAPPSNFLVLLPFVVCAGWLSVVRTRFAFSRRGLGELGAVLCIAGFVGGIVIGVTGTQGSERGRQAFVAELQTELNAPGATRHEVTSLGRILIITLPDQPMEAVDREAADTHAALVQSGSRAKAWAVGFSRIAITNGTYQRELTPSDPD